MRSVGGCRRARLSIAPPHRVAEVGALSCSISLGVCILIRCHRSIGLEAYQNLHSATTGRIRALLPLGWPPAIIAEILRSSQQMAKVAGFENLNIHLELRIGNCGEDDVRESSECG